MGIADRIEGTIENWRKLWGRALNDFIVNTMKWGMDAFFDLLGRSAASKLKPLVDMIEATKKVPPELQPILDELKSPSGEAGAMFAQSAGSALVGGAIGKILDAVLLPMAYAANTATRNVILGQGQLLASWLRDETTDEQLHEYLSWMGIDNADIEKIKLLTKYVPSAPEQVMWLAREVYEPDMIAKYGLDSELPVYEETDFKKIGVTPEMMRNYWRAHWEHASWMQVVEMLHRDLMTEEEVWEWFRVVEIPPYWRQLLIDTAYTWPTRVDVRRWWDMRTIDETELRRLYSGMGYRGVNLDNYVLWTKVYVAFPDLMARWTKGWITLDVVRTELTNLGMPAERVEEMIQMKVKPEQAERTVKERDITKTDIYKGVKQGVITRGEAVELLIDLGFEEDEAIYLLEINIPKDEEDEVVKQRDLTKSDILKGLKTEVITRAEAMTKLLALRYRSADAEFLLKIFDAQVKPPTEPREREASKADIIAAVKKGLITPEEAYLMLQDIGFTPEASEFILAVRAETSPFSPINYTEFKELTSKYKRAIGKEEKPMPEELKKAAEEVVRLTGEVEALERSIVEEKRGLIEGEVLPEETTARLDELQVAKNRAISELERVKSEYDRLVAEWKHGLPFTSEG